MKRYTEMEEQELATATEDQINILIEIEVAHAGIFSEKVPVTPTLEKEGISQSELGYAVGNTIFVNEEDAKAVLLMPRLIEEYNYNISYSYKWFSPIVSGKVEKQTAYKQEDIMRIAKHLQENEQKRNVYNSEKQKYDKYLDATGKIRNAVWSAINQARENAEDLQKAKDLLAHYTKLAEGDAKTAEVFFRNAYKNYEEMIEKVLRKQDTTKENK